MEVEAYSMEERKAYLGNLKFIAITLVIVGLVINRYAVYTISDGLFSYRAFLKFFSMPLLLFLCGMDVQERCKGSRGPSLNDIVYDLGLYFLFFYFLYSVRSTYSKPEWNPFSTSSAPGLFLVLTILGALTVFAVQIEMGWRLVLPLSVGFALIAGFYKEFGEFLCLGLVSNLAPFFFAGLYLKPESLMKRTAHWRSLKFPIAIAVALLVGALAVSFMLPHDVVDSIYLMTLCHKSYADCGTLAVSNVFFLRAGWYVLASCLGLAVCTLSPRRETFLSGLGERWAQAYVLHTFIIAIAAGYGTFKRFAVMSVPYAGVWLTLLGVALTVLTCLPQVPTSIARLIRDNIHVAQDQD